MPSALAAVQAGPQRLLVLPQQDSRCRHSSSEGGFIDLDQTTESQVISMEIKPRSLFALTCSLARP
jgi:hypothetical protein